jgi:medium-chain acyl-[acyl-carrier-protein] hydrolase
MNNLRDSNPTSFLTFKVTSADTDMYARLRLGSLVNYLIQSAIDSADRLGFGYGGIRHQNLFWVLSRFTVELYRPLKWYETIEVETWPKSLEKLLYLRDFTLRDKDRKIIANATSGWLAVDLTTKRIKKIEGIHADIFDHLKKKHSIFEPPLKLHPVSEGVEFEIRSGYFDIDLNRHVTTTRYVDWMMDTFTLDFHKNHYARKFSLNIMKETMPGETIRLRRNQSNEGQFDFEGINMNSNKNAFRACIEF